MSIAVYPGIALIGAAMLFAAKARIEEEEMVLSEYEDMLRFLLHAKRSLSSFLLTPREICDSFVAQSPVINGLKSRFADGRRDGLLENSRIARADKNMLEGYFSRFGTSGYECESEELDRVCAELEMRVRSVREQSEKSRKLIPVICVFAFVSLVLLIL